MTNLSRRGFFGVLAAVVAAPMIVRVESLMVLPRPSVILPPGLVALEPQTAVEYAVGNNLMTIDMITREAVRLFQNSNKFLQAMQFQWKDDFAFTEGNAWNQISEPARLPFVEWSRMQGSVGTSPTHSNE